MRAPYAHHPSSESYGVNTTIYTSQTSIGVNSDLKVPAVFKYNNALSNTKPRMLIKRFLASHYTHCYIFYDCHFDSFRFKKVRVNLTLWYEYGAVNWFICPWWSFNKKLAISFSDHSWLRGRLPESLTTCLPSADLGMFFLQWQTKWVWIFYEVIYMIYLNKISSFQMWTPQVEK